ncbi:hypothetical protein KP509_29G077800 [Ceratopteris richardii]|uniref:protein-serine/threonine phosphatase n=1 Tax=Ceratopteris richardii TaxID=49495 RepID=A0A8T2R9N3_CERRI|nr:hypothetical protein KP509_29G077800 [Ceratopteris richardii]
MDANNPQTPCLIEKPQTLLGDHLATARRKRREMRLLTKLSCTSPPSTKRSGPRSVYGWSSMHLLDEGVCLKEAGMDDILPFVRCKGYDNQADANGLIRSRSFPPEGWHSSRYVLQISRIGRSSSKINGKSGHFQALNSDAAHGTHSQGNLALQLQSVNEPPLDNLSSSFKVATNPPQEIDIDMGSREVDCRSNEPPKVSTDDLCVDGANAPSKIAEADPSNPCRDAMLDSKQVCQLKSPPSGKVLICGRRREMEDTAVIVPSFARIPKCSFPVELPACHTSDLHFYGVYDGHGGSQASSYCAQRLHHALAEEISQSSMTEASGVAEWQNVMLSCFMKVDKEVGGVCPFGVCDDVDSTAGCCSGSIAPENVGTTAVVTVVSPSQIVLANCGDSRAVLSRAGRAIPLSQDHKPERADETSRIEAAGGRVIAWQGYRVGALLAVSRSIGDRYLKRYVISEPDVVCLERTDEDECLILASDGLWDVIDNETACNVARKCLTSAHGRERRTTAQGYDLASATAAATLVKLACGKGSQDNITVVVVDMRLHRR